MILIFLNNSYQPSSRILRFLELVTLRMQHASHRNTVDLMVWILACENISSVRLIDTLWNYIGNINRTLFHKLNSNGIHRLTFHNELLKISFSQFFSKFRGKPPIWASVVDKPRVNPRPVTPGMLRAVFHKVYHQPPHGSSQWTKKK